MQIVVVSDTSCLITLDKIGELALLRTVYGKIIVTGDVAKEFGETLPNWFSIENPTNKGYQTILEATVDKGEASAIAFALEQSDCLLIIDDLKGRNLAVQLGIKVTGTFGIVIEAKLAGKIESVKPLLEKIKQTNFRLTAELEKKVLEQANEQD